MKKIISTILNLLNPTLKGWEFPQENDKILYNLRDTQGNIIIEKRPFSRLESYMFTYPGAYVIEVL